MSKQLTEKRLQEIEELQGRIVSVRVVAAIQDLLDGVKYLRVTAEAYLRWQLELSPAMSASEIPLWLDGCGYPTESPARMLAMALAALDDVEPQP